MEAITSRPLLLHAIGKEISHAGQTVIQITSMHGSTGKVQKLLNRVATFFSEFKSYAEQLTSEQRWLRILSKSVEKYLGGRMLFEPTYLAAPS